VAAGEQTVHFLDAATGTLLGAARSDRWNAIRDPRYLADPDRVLSWSVDRRYAWPLRWAAPDDLPADLDSEVRRY
jgi:hypothetical protein